MKLRKGSHNATGLKFGIVVAKFNKFVTSKLLSSCIDGLTKHGVVPEDIEVVRVPGAFEIPLVARTLAGTKRFDAVICLFDAIGYVQTNAKISDVFHGVHKHLRPNGLFIFEFWHAAAMLRHYDPIRVRRWPTDDGLVLRISGVTHPVVSLQVEGRGSDA